MIAVVDSGVANLTSVMAALHRLGAEAEITRDADVIRRADKVILPGVGAAAPAMQQLRDKGLVEVLRGLTCPTLGICLGMQLMFEHMEESNGVEGLGMLPGSVKLMQAAPDRPVPHMGWNTLTLKQAQHPLLHGVHDNDYVYFVHSYAVPVDAVSLATAEYGADFPAVAGKGNFYGCQFHPERSGKVGSLILKNFLNMGLAGNA